MRRYPGEFCFKRANIYQSNAHPKGKRFSAAGEDVGGISFGVAVCHTRIFTEIIVWELRNI